MKKIIKLKQRFMTHKKILLIIMLSLIFKLSFASSSLVVAISASPNNLVPFYSTDANSQNINRLVHKALVVLNSRMQYECELCRNYEEKVENKKHIFIFHLKDDALFFDGTKITAADFKNSWELYTHDKDINSTFMETFEDLEQVEVINPTTLKLVYKGFSLENLSNLALIKIFKIKENKKKNLEPADILGSGDYAIEKVAPLETILTPKDKTKNKIIFKVVKDETTLALKLLNGEVDLSVASMSPRKVSWLKEKKDILNIWEIPSSNFIFLGMNQQKPIFQNRNIRKAISLLIPREDLLKYKLKGTAALATGMFSPAFKDFYVERKLDKYDPDQAMDLFKSAGYVKNKNGILTNGKELFTIDWKVSNNKSSIETAEVLKDRFEKNGIIVKLTILEWGTYMSNFKSGKFDIVVGQWIGFTGPDMLRFVFHSAYTPPKGGNRIHYNNGQFDQLIDQATAETDLIKRNNLYRLADNVVTEDYAYANLWHPNVIWIGNKCLSNIELEPTGSFISIPKINKVEHDCDGKKSKI